MNFLTSLFGDSGNSLLTAAFALGAVLVAIVLVLWVIKALSRASGNVARGRNRRLAVVDSLALDPKRQLLIIRRDNVEHLILTGGPQDVVVETGIPVEEQATVPQPSRRPIPMVAARKPAPAKAAPPVAPPVASPVAPAGETAIERLREMGQPTDKKAHLSLRHTGLLRPIGAAAGPLAAENGTTGIVAGSDSARQGMLRRDAEGADLAEDGSGTTRN